MISKTHFNPINIRLLSTYTLYMCIMCIVFIMCILCIKKSIRSLQQKHTEFATKAYGVCNKSIRSLQHTFLQVIENKGKKWAPFL